MNETSLYLFLLLTLMVSLGIAPGKAQEWNPPTHEIQAYIPGTQPKRSEVIHCLKTLCHQKAARLIFQPSCFNTGNPGCPQVIVKNLTLKTSQRFVGWNDTVHAELVSALSEPHPQTIISGGLP
ncbi:MAG: hypothetical protein KKD44_17255 [Proteobacteria bacterium]|nr:hypothetical protein [Pseudomonadota bacterium]